MKFSVIITISLLLIGCENSNEIEILPEEQNKIEINISINDNAFNVGELPKLTAEISNNSKDQVFFYTDFNFGYYPKISLKLFDGITDSVLGCYIFVRSPREYLLEEKYFISLEPEQSLKLINDSDKLISGYSCILKNRGYYKIHLELDNSDEDLSSWTTKDEHDASILNMFNLIPKEKFISNEVFFSIK